MRFLQIKTYKPFSGEVLVYLLPFLQKAMFRLENDLPDEQTCPKSYGLISYSSGRGLFPSREQARRAILAGEISIATRVADKPAQLLDGKSAITVKPTRKYVGRGALKLENAPRPF